MAQPPLLPEVSEADSEGEVAELYADIRRTLAIPFVGLIYRTLAVEPPRLAAVWSRLGPLLGHPTTWAAAAALDPGLQFAPALTSVKSLAEVGLGASLARRAGATLAAYDRMNRLNLIGLSALLTPNRASIPTVSNEKVGDSRTRWTRDELLPMPAMTDLSAADRDLLVQISDALLPGQRPVLVPSLLRHFARPGVLPVLWECVGPAVEAGFVPAAAAGLRQQAGGLPFPSVVTVAPITDPAVLEIARSFVAATSTMVVLGALLARSLDLRRSD